MRKKVKEKKMKDYDEFDYFHYGGKVWGIKLVEIEPIIKGERMRRRWNAVPVCLGEEEDVMERLRKKEEENDKVS